MLLENDRWSYDINPTIVNTDYIVYAVFSPSNREDCPIKVYEICVGGNFTFYIDADSFNRIQCK